MGLTLRPMSLGIPGLPQCAPLGCRTVLCCYYTLKPGLYGAPADSCNPSVDKAVIENGWIDGWMDDMSTFLLPYAAQSDRLFMFLLILLLKTHGNHPRKNYR